MHIDNCMGLFENMLNSEESLIKDDTALDYEFIPKLIKYRENEQQHIASCLKPLFQQRSGRNLLICGSPGIGKTVAVKHVLQELEEETDEIEVFFINCWHHNTTYKILLEISNLFGYVFTQNKKTVELYNLLQEKLSATPCVFVFDEIDKVDDTDFLYFILEKIIKKSIFLITNYKSWLADLDIRVKSRLMAEILEFKEYTSAETKGILDWRKDYAFAKNVWELDAFSLVAKKTYSLGDIRAGLFLLKESALIAEESLSKKIIKKHVETSIEKLDKFTIKNSESLDKESKNIFEIIKQHSNTKIGELFKIYQDNTGSLSYKSFQRRIAKLDEGKFISIAKQTGAGGNTTIIKLRHN